MMPVVVVSYREKPRGKWWQDTYTPITFGEYYEELPSDVPAEWIAVDYSVDYSDDGKVRVLATEFHYYDEEYWTGPHEPMRYVVGETLEKEYADEHSVQVETNS